jgi:hypothetical protein
MKHCIIDYFHYIDILIIYNPHNMNIENTPVAFNSLHPQIIFTTENETEFTNLSIHDNHKFI